MGDFPSLGRVLGRDFSDKSGHFALIAVPWWWCPARGSRRAARGSMRPGRASRRADRGAQVVVPGAFCARIETRRSAAFTGDHAQKGEGQG
jgi:hypothetical protein